MIVFSSVRRGPGLLAGFLITMLLALGDPTGAAAAGSSPQDPIPFTLGASPVQVAGSGNAPIWLRLSFTAASTVSHADLETQGSVDTTIQVFANLSEALNGAPIAEDDDSGSGFNALVQVPLGFLPPYYVRLTGSGSFSLRATGRFVAAGHCDWPAGCPLALIAEGEPGAGDMLKVLRDVRGELLSRSAQGRSLTSLYWRLGLHLIPDLMADRDFRERLHGEVRDLLPLARAALDAGRKAGDGTLFTRADLDRLQQLLLDVKARVSAEAAADLQGRWSSFALEGKVGKPLSIALLEMGLLPGEDVSRTVIVKLRREPAFEKKGGELQLRTGEARLDKRLAAAGAGALRPVHKASSDRQAAGLTRIVAFEVPGLEKARSLVADLAADPAVEWAEISVNLRALGSGPDPFRGDLWGLDAVRAPQAWSSGSGNCETPVAIVDTGLRSGIADLEGRVLSSRGYDFANGDPNPEDGHGHGTHVAGTIAAAYNNATSVAGVAPAACVFAVKVLTDSGEGSSEAVAAGIVHAADQGARVINLSLGCDCDVQQVIEDALAYAASRDVVVVAAAGNDSKDHLGYPASSARTISVAAVDRNLALADFSNHGPGLDLAAPGVDVVSLFRDGESCTGSGTSMATPHVAGVAALVRSLNPALNREQVRALLREKARDLGAPGYDTSFGAGLVDAAAAASAAGGGGGGGTGPCTSTSTVSCLGQGRFRVETFWRRPDGGSGQGTAVNLTSDTGYFWFFDGTNIEMFIKVLNACGVNGRFWVFAGGLTNLEVRIRITDTTTGQVKEYLNPLGTAFQPVQDTNAFSCGGGLSVAEDEAAKIQLALADRIAAQVAPAALPRFPESAPLVANCTESATSLCLASGRFRVEANWRTANGQSGAGLAVRLTPDTGYFWFFNSANVEAFVKVLNACGFGNRYWVFGGGLTNVEVRLRVTDTATNQVKEYLNPMGVAFRPIQDTNAFMTCP